MKGSYHFEFAVEIVENDNFGYLARQAGMLNHWKTCSLMIYLKNIKHCVVCWIACQLLDHIFVLQVDISQNSPKILPLTNFSRFWGGVVDSSIVMGNQSNPL